MVEDRANSSETRSDLVGAALDGSVPQIVDCAREPDRRRMNALHVDHFRAAYWSSVRVARVSVPPAKAIEVSVGRYSSPRRPRDSVLSVWREVEVVDAATTRSL